MFDVSSLDQTGNAKCINRNCTRPKTVRWFRRVKVWRAESTAFTPLNENHNGAQTLRLARCFDIFVVSERGPDRVRFLFLVASVAIVAISDSLTRSSSLEELR